MNRYVQGIIIKDSYVLMGFKRNENDSYRNAFIGGEVLDGETPEKSLERIVSEKLGVPISVLFKVNRESYNNMNTYYVEAAGLALEDNLESKGLRWLSLHDKEAFSYNDKMQLMSLLDTSLGRGYCPEWIKPLEELILTDSRFSYAKDFVLKKKRSLEHRELDASILSSHKILMIFLSLFIGVIYDAFFSEFKFGISVPIFAAMLTAIFFYSSRNYIKRVNITGLLMLTMSLLLSMNFAIHSNLFLTVLNTLALPILLTGSYILIRYEDTPWKIGGFIARILGRLFPHTGENFFKPFSFVKTSIKSGERSKMSPATKSVLIGLGASLPLLLIIIPLLSSADSVFSYYVSNASNIFTNIRFDTAIRDVIIISFVTLYSFGYLWSFRYDSTSVAVKEKRKGILEPITVLTVLIVINLVYLLFTVVQASYLYGGENTALPNGFTYAEYARRGFFELVLVTVINFTILTLCRKYTKGENTSVNKILRGAYTILIFFTLNMLYSANFKMSLYERAFGYTYLRVYVQLFLIFLFLIFIIALSGIWSSRIQTAKLSIIVALVMYLVVNYINVDVIIVKKNIERFYITGNIDSHYLTQLSDDAVPVIVEFIDSSSASNGIKNSLLQNLNNRSGRLYADKAWYEFNFSRNRARKAIEER